MDDFTTESWLAQVEELKVEGADAATIAAALRKRGASQRDIATAMSIGRTTARRLLDKLGAERPALNGSGALTPTSSSPSPGTEIAPLTTAADLVADELKRAAEFQAKGELGKAALLADRARVRGASEAQVRAALSISLPTPTSGPVAANGFDHAAESSAARHTRMPDWRHATEAEAKQARIVGIALGLGLVLALSVIAWKMRSRAASRAGELEPATDPGEIEAEALVSEIASQFGEAVDHLGEAVLV